LEGNIKISIIEIGCEDLLRTGSIDVIL